MPKNASNEKDEQKYTNPQHLIPLVDKKPVKTQLKNDGFSILNLPTHVNQQ